MFVAIPVAFALITPALIISAYAERMKFVAIFVVSAFLFLVVCAPATHRVRVGVVMAAWDAMNFANDIVVQATAGSAALVCALVVGKCRDFPPFTASLWRPYAFRRHQRN